MDETHSNRSRLNRRTLINLIAILAVVQAGILIYLWTLLRPSTPQEAAEPTIQQFQLPSAASTSVPDDARPTPGSAEIVVGQPVRASNYADRALAFDEEQALEHIAYLASDELAGRQPGTTGGRAAGDYIAAALAKYGLQPAGVDGDYFQNFTAPYGRIIEPPALAIIPPAGETLTRAYAYRSDYRALTGGYVGAGEGEGPVVWLNECLHADYAGLDLVGKILLCRYTNNDDVYRQAIEHQIGGLLLLDREKKEGEPFRRGGYRETAWVPQTIPAYLISENVAEDLLVGTDYTLDGLSLRFTATPLSTTARLAVVVEEQEDVEARNVLGLLPGSDPEHGGEIVVIGAHYDHLGTEPDGAVMNGANDNGSGVAAMLEIARLWQTQSYHPARSVLFAAWDGEELGLLGSRYYAQHPTYPLTLTVANLNLDMVGAGESLRVDGEGAVAAQLQAGAETYGITTTLTFDGRSDHMAFHEAGIPAANLIYWPDTYYHTPEDVVAVIEPEKLKQAGVLSAHTLAALAQGHVELERAVERLEAAIATGDRDVFLAGLDPAAPSTGSGQALQTAQAAWFDNIWSRELTEIEIEPSRFRIGDDKAIVSLSLAYRWADAARRESPAFYDARFVQREGAWYWAGYEMDTLSGNALTVARFPDVPVESSQLLSTTQQAYLAITADMGVEPITSTRCIYYPNAATLRAIARPAADRETGWLVSSERLVELTLAQPITPVIVHLALNQMGLPPGEGNWLREGLALHYENGDAADYLSLLAASDAITPLLDFPALADLPDSEAQPLRAQAWGAAEYLLDRYSVAGLRDLCAAWGRSGQEAAFQQALGLSLSQFEAAWRADRLDPLRADSSAIQAAIAARVEAALAGDEAGFLATLDPSNAVLRAEQRNWFAGLAEHPITSYEATGEIVAWSPGGDEAVVALTVSQVTYDARFTRAGGRWLYAGVDWNNLAGEHFILKHQGGDAVDPQRILDLAEEAYAQISADLDATIPLTQEIKLYGDADLFRASISPSQPDVDSWAGPGTAIKLWLREGGERAIQEAIARELTLQSLSAQELETDWLREGIAAFEAGRATPLGAHWAAGKYWPVVQDAVRRHNEFPLYEMPSWIEVPDGQADLFRAQSWSLVEFIVERHGLAGLRRLVARSIASEDTAANLRAALGADPATFQEEWREYARIAGVPGDLLSLAQRFDSERAMEHVATLASPEFGGRRAGSPGADLTADYIAAQFAALGLEPLGDPVSDTQLSYLQQFPVSYTQAVSVPTFALLDGDGALLHTFTYRQDFLERPSTGSGHSAGQGVAGGELVWVRQGNLEGMQFGGAVALEENISDARIQQLEEHGAGGVIVVTGQESDDLQSSYAQVVSGTETNIPVFEITGPAFETLLEQLGIEQRELTLSPPSLPLGVRARLSLARPPVTTTLTANVLGLLPGSDPDLADEVILVGAHYDHIGRLPDGFYFPGANQNASGVAAMLEMAQVWQSAGYRPARSVLFAAWGAEELGSAGVAHYLAAPNVPLTQTVGVIALEAIAGGKGYKLMFHGTREHDLALIHRFESGYPQLDRRAWRAGNTGAGWHTPFNTVGIPTSKLIWDEAEEDFYLPSDTADRVDPERLASSGEVLTLVVSWLAGR